MAAHLNALGIARLDDLKGEDSKALYAQECFLKGCMVDRCVLYGWPMPRGALRTQSS